ncbi:hypothetical protein [Gordonia soli]|uniref:Cobalamin-independent methionine synthase MetE C-terminal/archaeal domain-containing protein n=1 Tax=Gordonia soli NBRC 108243 TaxID=1223545 RepID=M0QCS9_9ACTN|nr:hypothetical protein [Gordonia soli]GAC66355.1 hypothetical protein GS4_02_00650 [Gordonia soli NBRC 108243]
MSSPFAGLGTGVGSMPQVAPTQAAEIVTGELDLAFLPELPSRGLGADLIGRMAALLVDIPLDVSSRGYRLSARPSAVSRRADELLRRDLDAIEELWDGAGFIGTARPFKIQACGPFTLAASVEAGGGHKAIRDRGAWTDLVESTTEGLRVHAAEVVRRLGVEVLVQIDEPSVGAVIDGRVTPLSRLDTVPPVPVADVAEALSGLVEKLGHPVVVHSCDTPRWDLIDQLPAAGFSLDVTALTTADLDGIGGLVDRGALLVAGIVPSTEQSSPLHADEVAGRLAALVDRIGLDREVLARNVIVTPTCGLAGATPMWSVTALGLCARAAQALAEDPTAV